MSIDADGLRTSLKPVRHPPSLHTVNLSGTTFVGVFRIPELAPCYFTLAAVMFFGIPLFPLRVYLVEQPTRGSFRFFGEISRRDFRRVCPAGMRRLRGAFRFQAAFMLTVWGLIVGGIIGVILLL